MRSYAIELANTPLELRQQLHAALLAAGEPVFEDTRFHRDEKCNANYLVYRDGSKNAKWLATDNSSSPKITIQDFLAKFFPQQVTTTESMRNYAIIVAGTSVKDRQALLSFLKDNKEHLESCLYDETGDFQEEAEYTYYSYLRYHKATNKWDREHYSNGLPTISIADFLIKFTPTKVEAPTDYAIDIRNSTPSDRITIRNFLKDIGDNLEKYLLNNDTNYILQQRYDAYKYIRIFSSRNKWERTVGTGDKPTISINDFIAKFAHLAPTTTKVVEPTTIQVGQVYKNSNGKKCTIKKLVNFTDVVYIHEDGKDYDTTTINIKKNWKLQTIETKEPTMAKDDHFTKIYKPGDTLWVRPDLQENKYYSYDSYDSYDLIGYRSSIYVNNTMARLAGKKVTIDRIRSNGMIRLTKSSYDWALGMLVPEDPNKDRTPIQMDSSHIYKVGDMVRIRPDLDADKRYATHDPETDCDVSGYMLNYRGKVGTILQVLDSGRKYFLDIDKEEWNWSSGMLIPVGEEEDLATKTVEQLGKETTGAKAKTWTIPRSPYMEKQTTKGNTFMSKLKVTAEQTVDQNKQALVIASKMEAGRIINKQVLKQLTPHLPFFVQGYTKSPFAPFVAANLVAMVANHTQNAKLQKVSELMVLGAADSGVTAFNLDKIIDDILANIKLPAGISFDTEE